MSTEREGAAPNQLPAGTFPSTCWSRLAAGQAGEEEAGRALETLAARYWPAVVAWLARGPAASEEEARDLAQGFFVQVLETGFLSKADPRKGRFRVFLKSSLRNFVASRSRETAAAKRGGGRRFVPLHDDEGRTLPIASHAQGPDEALDDAWRGELIEGALAATRARLVERGQLLRYQVFHAYHVEGTEDDYEALAARHGITRTDVSNHLARAKALFREELRNRVLDTVGSDEELRAELAWLLEDDRK